MSQEQASQRTTSHLSHAAMVPNMLPMAHAGTPMPGAGATGGQFFLPPMAPSQDPFPAARPHHTYVPDLAYPSLYSYPPMQPRGVRRPPPNGLVMPPKFKVDNNMNISFQGLRRDSQEHENTGNPQTIPAYRESLKRSRLPSDGAARKTPVKATSSTSSRPDISSPNTSWKQPRKLAKSIKSGILRTTASKQPRRQNSPLKQLETPVPSPPKRRRAIMDEDDETDETDETDEANFPQPSVVSPAPSEMISKPDSRPRPRYDYTVPEELESTRTALGLDNWDEYVALMENLWLKDITAHEFNDQAKRIFWMCDDRIRVRMNSLVIRRMIVPGLEEQATAKENIDEMMAAAGGATKS